MTTSSSIIERYSTAFHPAAPFRHTLSLIRATRLIRYTLPNTNKLRARRRALRFTISHKFIVSTINTARIDTSPGMFISNKEQNGLLAQGMELDVGRGGATFHEGFVVFVGVRESILADPGVGETVQVFVVSLECRGGAEGCITPSWIV